MYSNCLFEAWKAKLKDWNNVYIFNTPKELNGIRHFMWKKGDKYYHAKIASNRHWWNYAWHKVKFKEIPNYIFDVYIVNYSEWEDLKTKKKIAKITNSDFAKIGKDWTWSLAEYRHDELISKEAVEYFEKVLKIKAKFKIIKDGEMQIVDYERLLKLSKTKEDFEWKLLDYFDGDFARAYRNKAETDWEKLQ